MEVASPTFGRVHTRLAAARPRALISVKLADSMGRAGEPPGQAMN